MAPRIAPPVPNSPAKIPENMPPNIVFVLVAVNGSVFI